MYEINRKIFFS